MNEVVDRPLTDTEYLHFDEIPKIGKTRRIVVLSRRAAHLGDIRWYGAWRQYVFDPAPKSTFNNSCLISLADKLGYLNTMHRVGRAALAEKEKEDMNARTESR